MKQLSYSQLKPIVDNLFNKSFEKDEVEAINKHIDDIHGFIESVGWTTQEYSDYLMGFKSLELS